jgi:flagellar basal body-associated protein FliL
VKELEDIRPTVATQVLTPLPARRSFPWVPVIVALAVVALVVGLVFAFHGGGPPKQERRDVAPVAPVPHAATAERQARNLSAWLARYSR